MITLNYRKVKGHEVADSHDASGPRGHHGATPETGREGLTIRSNTGPAPRCRGTPGSAKAGRLGPRGLECVARERHVQTHLGSHPRLVNDKRPEPTEPE